MPAAPRFPASSAVSSASGSSVWPGFLVAASAAVAGWVLAVLAVWAGGGGGPSPSTARAASQVWLVAHGTGLEAEGVAITVVPWGTVALVIGLVVLATRRVVRDPVAEPAAFAATAAGTYGVLAAVVAAVTSTGDASVPFVRAAFMAFVVVGVAAALGYVVAQGVPDAWWPQDQPELRAVVRGAGTAVVAVLVTSLALVVVLLALHVERAGRLWALLDPGFGGGIVLAAACVLLVPTLALWAASALMGPGFRVGSDTSVDLTAANLGEVPGLPVLAALPSPGDLPAWTFLLGLVPAIAALVAGWRLVRRGHVDTGTDFWRGVGVAAVAGGVGALALTVLVWLSGGSVGPGRMSEVGPDGLLPLLRVVPVMAVAAAIGAVLAHYRGGRATGS